jgi:hypothetical protein
LLVTFLLLAAPGLVWSQAAIDATRAIAPSIVPRTVHADGYGDAMECSRGFERQHGACDQNPRQFPPLRSNSAPVAGGHVGVDVGHANLGAFGQELSGDLLTDAAGVAGDRRLPATARQTLH